MTLRIPTAKLHPYVKLLIKDMREGMFKYSLKELVAAETRGDRNGETVYRRPGLPTDDGFSYANFKTLADAYKAQKSRKRYSPREVSVTFVPGTYVTINVSGFSFNAANGEEVSRDEKQSTWMGSDGEPNYTRQVTFRGPTVAHFGYSARDSRVELFIPTGLSDEGRTFTAEQVNALGLKYWSVESPLRLFVEQYAGRIAKDPMVLTVLVDACMEGKSFWYTEDPDVVKVQNAALAGKAQVA